LFVDDVGSRVDHDVGKRSRSMVERHDVSLIELTLYTVGGHGALLAGYEHVSHLLATLHFPWTSNGGVCLFSYIHGVIALLHRVTRIVVGVGLH